MESDMKDHEGTNQELIEKISFLKQRIKELECSKDDSKQVEESLRESEEKYRSIFENAVEGFFQSTLEGRFLAVNPAFAKIFGYASPEEIISTISDISRQYYVNPEDRRRYMELLQETGTLENFEFKALRKDGSQVWISNSTRAIVDGEGAIIRYDGIVEDITKRKRTEEELKQSEERYRTIINEIEDGYQEVDLEGNFIFCNESFCKIFGYSKSELLRSNFRRYAADEGTADRIYRAYNRMYKTGTPLKRFEWDIITKEGVRRSIEFSASLLRDGEGHRSGFRGIVRDVTDRKLVEDQYRMMANSAQTGVYIVQDGKLCFVNPHILAYSGYTEEELIGKRIIHVVHPDDRDMVREKARKMLAGELTAPYEYRIMDKNNQIKWLIEKVTPISYRGRSAVMGNTMDMTDRKQTEAKLGQQTDAMEAAIDGMALLNEKGEYIYLNKSHANLYGYENTGELIGKSWKSLYDSDVLQRFEQEIMPELSRKGDWHGESIGTKKNGSKFPQELSLTAMSNGGLICVVRDITGRKFLESQLLQAQKMEAIGTLSGGIAHDFNNILSAMIGYTELAMREQDERRRQYDLKQVLQACERATNLVSQILTFSRKSDVEKKPVNIGYIVKEAANLLRAAIPTTIEIRQSIDSGHMIVLANHTQIHQIIMNLCTNAAHAMTDRGGVMEIKLTSFEIASDSPLISLELTPGSYVKLEVSDSGHGIEPAYMNRIFDPFFTTKGVSEGTGLGLSMVYGIAKGHGGNITVDSVPGSGSTFTVYLPTLSHQETKADLKSEEIPRGNERILFVDDEPILAALGKDMLQGAGYKVTDSTGSVQALEVFTENPDDYDLIITDMAMPFMMGIDLAKEIWNIRPEIPVILCTGHSDLIDEEKAKKEGIKRFITKPLRQRELAKAVRGVLDELKQPT